MSTVLGHGSVGPNPRGKPPWKGHSSSQSLGLLKLWQSRGQRGKGNSVQHSETRSWGEEAAKQLTTEDHRVVKPEESFLFSLTSLTPRITFQLEQGV